MKRRCAILISLLALPIVGGCDNRKSDMAACQIEAVRRHPDAKDGGSLKDYSDFVTACLEAKGYRVNTQGK
jgi:hypothetical protein